MDKLRMKEERREKRSSRLSQQPPPPITRQQRMVSAQGNKPSEPRITRGQVEATQQNRRSEDPSSCVSARLRARRSVSTVDDGQKPSTSKTKLAKRRTAHSLATNPVIAEFLKTTKKFKRTKLPTADGKDFYYLLEKDDFAEKVRDSNEPYLQAVDMIAELQDAHEEFQASVIVANCLQKMGIPERRRRKTEEKRAEDNDIGCLMARTDTRNPKDKQMFLMTSPDGSQDPKQWAVPVFSESEERLGNLCKSYAYIAENEHPLASEKPNNSSTYKCRCGPGACGSKCSCVQASIIVGGAFIYHKYIIVGGSVDGWTSAVITCGPLCACKGMCSNSGQTFSDGTMGLELFDAKQKGWGVRIGEQGAESGRILFSFIGEIIDEEEHERRQILNNGDWTWQMYQGEGTDMVSQRMAVYFNARFKQPQTSLYIDPLKRGNIGRFVNCSEIPNAAGLRMFVNDLRPEMTKYIFYATRSIAPHEEILIDYGDNYEGITVCCCGQELCPHDKRWKKPGGEERYLERLNNFNHRQWACHLPATTSPTLSNLIAFRQTVQDQRQLCIMIQLLKYQIEKVEELTRYKKLNVTKLKEEIAEMAKDYNKTLDEQPEGEAEDIIVVYEDTAAKGGI